MAGRAGAFDGRSRLLGRGTLVGQVHRFEPLYNAAAPRLLLSSRELRAAPCGRSPSAGLPRAARRYSLPKALASQPAALERWAFCTGRVALARSCRGTGTPPFWPWRRHSQATLGHELLSARALVRGERAAGEPAGQQVRAPRACGAAQIARADAPERAAPRSSALPFARTPWRATCSSSRPRSRRSCSRRAASTRACCENKSRKLWRKEVAEDDSSHARRGRRCAAGGRGQEGGRTCKAATTRRGGVFLRCAAVTTHWHGDAGPSVAALRQQTDNGARIRLHWAFPTRVTLACIVWCAGRHC